MNNSMNNKTHTSHIKFLPLKGVGGSLWLFLELIVITIVAWVVIDPAVVNLYYRSLPIGCDLDRLVYLRVDRTHDCDVFPGEHISKLNNQLKTIDGVETTCYGNDPTIGRYNSYESICYEKDTIHVWTKTIMPDCNFYETYGIEPLPGSPSAEELSKLKADSKQIVLSETVAKATFGTTEGIVGRRIKRIVYREEPIEMTVAGVVKDIRGTLYNSERSYIYCPDETNYVRTSIVLRLKKGVNPTRFIEEQLHEIQQAAYAEQVRVIEIKPYREYAYHEEELTEEKNPQKVNMSLALAAFFILNLSLAVIGTVWLQAKRRTEECGVRRAYGATKPRLLFSFLTEGFLMATIAVVIGCVIFLNYAHSDYGVYESYEEFNMYHKMDNIIPSDQTWADHFWPHFLIVSGVVYLIILCTVLIGTAIPALKIINTRITEALREE